jgi:hypothetical protein
MHNFGSRPHTEDLASPATFAVRVEPLYALVGEAPFGHVRLRHRPITDVDSVRASNDVTFVKLIDGIRCMTSAEYPKEVLGDGAPR